MLPASRRPDLAGAGVRQRLLQRLPVAVLIGVYLAWFAPLSIRVYDGYGSPGFDMGVFDQGIWLLSRFHAPFVTITGRDLFGDHTSFVLLLMVPVYWVWPHVQALLVLQTALLAGAAIPVYMFARRVVASTWIATAVAASYLLNPALQNGNLEQFHPEAFLVPGIAVAVYAAFEWKPRLLLAAVVVCLLVKEDAALMVIPLGAWIWFRRDDRWGAAIMVGALGWMAFAFEVVIRSLLGTDSFYAGRLPFGGATGLLASPFTRPGRLAGYLAGDGRPFYLWQLAVSFGCVFLAAPEIAAIGALTLAENVLSAFPYMHGIDYHYSLALVPVLAMGTAFALGRMRNGRRRSIAALVVVTSAVVSSGLWGLLPFSRYGYHLPSPGSPVVATINRDLEAVPANAVVSASPEYVSHLDHRVRVYQWPTPFSAQLWGLYSEEGRRLPVASSVQYLILPSHLSVSDLAIFNSIASQFEQVATGGGVSVYRR